MTIASANSKIGAANEYSSGMWDWLYGGEGGSSASSNPTNSWNQNTPSAGGYTAPSTGAKGNWWGDTSNAIQGAGSILGTVGGVMNLADAWFDITGNKKAAKKAEKENRRAQAFANLMQAAGGNAQNVRPVQSNAMPTPNIAGAFAQLGGNVSNIGNVMSAQKQQGVENLRAQQNLDLQKQQMVDAAAGRQADLALRGELGRGGLAIDQRGADLADKRYGVEAETAKAQLAKIAAETSRLKQNTLLDLAEQQRKFMETQGRIKAGVDKLSTERLKILARTGDPQAAAELRRRLGIVGGGVSFGGVAPTSIM